MGNFSGVPTVMWTDSEDSEIRQERWQPSVRLKTLSYSEKKQTRRKRDKQSILLQIGISTWYEYFTLKYLRKLALYFRAWYLYNELPYDKSFWGKLRLFLRVSGARRSTGSTCCHASLAFEDFLSRV